MLTVISSFHSENSQMGKLELLIIENIAIHSSWSHNSLKTVWIPDLYRPAKPDAAPPPHSHGLYERKQRKVVLLASEI